MPEPDTTDRILEQSAWMRRLALAVVRDAAAADDIVQSAWLRALNSGPRQEGSLRAWLARVVHNLSLKELRGSERRSRREAVAARAEHEPVVEDAVQKIELLREMLDAMRRLDEPYRRTLTQLYLEGRSAAALARLEGVPAGTIRWRKKRALELMRQMLDRPTDTDSRSSCLPPLVGLAPRVRSQPIVSAATAPGVLVLNWKLKAILVVGILVVTITGVQLWNEPNSARTEPAAAIPQTAAASVNAVSVEEPPPTREEVLPAEWPVSPGSVPRITGIRARVLDQHLVPISFAKLLVDSVHRGATTAADGVVTVTLDAEARVQSVAHVTAAGFASRWLAFESTPGEITPLGDVVLERGASIRGRVFAPDGDPQPRAVVTVAGVDLFGDELHGSLTGPHIYPGAPEARTDAHGEFVLSGVSPGASRVWAKADGTRHQWSEPILIEAGDGIEGVAIRLVASTDADWIDGVVLDPDGRPVTDARVSLDFSDALWSWNRRVDLDSAARFHAVIQGAGPHDLRAEDPGGRWSAAAALGVQPGARDVELRFAIARRLTVGIHTTRGDLPEVVTIYAQRADSRVSIGAPPKTTVAPGEFEVEMPGEPFVLAIVVPGFATGLTQPIDPLAPPPRVDVTLERSVGVRGVVLANGLPVVDVLVRLGRSGEPGTMYEMNGFETLVNPIQMSDQRTDDAGRFAFAPEASGEYVLMAQSEGHAVRRVAGLRFDQSTGIEDIRVDLTRGGVIEGRALVPDGRRCEGIIVSINCGDTFARTLRVGADGHYRFDGLAAGDWQVRRSSRMIGRGRSYGVAKVEDYELRSDCVVLEGATTHFDLDLSDQRACLARGALRWGSTPASDWTVTLVPITGVLRDGPAPSTTLDEHGRFELATAHPGRFQLSFERPGGAGALHHPINLARGVTDTSLVITTATLDLQPPKGASDQLVVSVRGDQWRYFLAVDDPRGQVLELPAGMVQVQRERRSAGERRGHWHTVSEFSLATGARRTVRLD